MTSFSTDYVFILGREDRLGGSFLPIRGSIYSPVVRILSRSTDTFKSGSVICFYEAQMVTLKVSDESTRGLRGEYGKVVTFGRGFFFTDCSSTETHVFHASMSSVSERA